MNVSKFKSELRKNKEALKGKTVRVILNGVGQRYRTLRDLGNRILELESKGCSFSFYKNDVTTIIADNGIDMNRAIKEFGTNA